MVRECCSTRTECADSYNTASSHLWPNPDTAHLAHTADSFTKAVKASSKTKPTGETHSKHISKSLWVVLNLDTVYADFFSKGRLTKT